MANRGLVLFMISPGEYIKKRTRKITYILKCLRTGKTKYSLYKQKPQTTSTSHFHLLYIEPDTVDLKETHVSLHQDTCPLIHSTHTHRGIAITCAGK